ncbi:MAG: T9SS type A sorting domain-containing protein [Fidelibacterota bacterium]
MKTIKAILTSMLFTGILFLGTNLFAQDHGMGGGHHGGGNDDGGMQQDSLTVITVSGVTIIDSDMMQDMYYLDTDGDSEADYFLNFGPWWYEPESGVSRPDDGEYVTITGGYIENSENQSNVIIVYEINGEFWRNPDDSFGHGYGNGHMGAGFEMGQYDSQHYGGDMDWDFEMDSLQVVTVSGTVIIDDSDDPVFYLLDEDDDGSADYYLNFGPWWYEPESGATRPENGETVTITGGIHEHFEDIATIMVYEIDGLFWSDPYGMGGFGDQHGGHGGGCGNGSSYGDGNGQDSLDVVTVSGTAIVESDMMHDFYYLDEDGDWEADYFLNFGPWWYEPDSGATRPEDGDTITIVGGLHDQNDGLPTIMVYEINGLFWNEPIDPEDIPGHGVKPVQPAVSSVKSYPNPFNPVSTISYTVEFDSRMNVMIYNVNGQQVESIYSGYQPAGNYHFSWNASAHPSGAYFIRIQGENLNSITPIMLVK